MPKFRKKPIVIEAMRLTSETMNEIKEWCDGRTCSSVTGYEGGPIREMNQILIPTLEGGAVASFGDWVIKGIAGEFYPCKDDIFQKTYETA